jgi:2-dehydro-3-deoxyphosphogluconate aldolase / (4S)-4-hydroxy-2-oxoglutarate aldolase
MAIEWFMAQLQALRVLPLVTLDHPTSGVAVAHALGAAGLTCMEVSLRTEGALEAIEEIARHAPDVLLGAGTVMRAQQVDDAVAAGARFVGSPVVDREVIRRAGRQRLPVIPGIATHADAIAAAREGARVVRLALAPEADGHDMVRDFARLFPSMQFIPAGAIAPADTGRYLRERSVLAVASTRLTPYGAPPAEIRRLAEQAARAANA